MKINWKDLTGNEKRGTEVVGPFGEVFILMGYYNRPLRREDSIRKLNCSIRIRNCLAHSGILTIGQLLDAPKDHIYGIKNLGRKALRELISALLENGLETQLNYSDIIKDRPEW